MAVTLLNRFRLNFPHRKFLILAFAFTTLIVVSVTIYRPMKEYRTFCQYYQDSSEEKAFFVDWSAIDSNDQIYFLETSQRDTVNFRQSCAVESAARQNRNRLVTLFVTNKNLNHSSPPVQLLSEYSNIRIGYIDLDTYFNNTALEAWYHEGKWRKGPYSVSHMSDYLRFLSVYRMGGQYIDLDFVITKPLEMKNYAVYESKNYFCSAIFHFDKGHPIVHRMVEKLANGYDPNVFAAYGPGLVTDTIQKYCNITDGVARGPDCGDTGIRAVEPQLFFPYHFSQWKLYFQNNTNYDLPEPITKAYGVHVWNKMSKEEPVVVGSTQHYAILAAKYCPLTFAAALNKF